MAVIERNLFLELSTYSVGTFLTAVGLVGNNILLVKYAGKDGAAAAALVSPIVYVATGGTLGFLLSLGIKSAMQIHTDPISTGHMTRSAWVLNGLMGAGATIFLLSAGLILPSAYGNTGRVARDYLLGFCGSAAPGIFTVITPQISFNLGRAYVPPLTTFGVYIVGLPLAWLLADKAGLKAVGVGLSTTITSFIVMALECLNLRRDHVYNGLNLFTKSIDNFSAHAKGLLGLGWKISLQLFTEWGNLLGLNAVLGGVWGNEALIAMNPSFLVMLLMNLTQQGIAHSAAMITGHYVMTGVATSRVRKVIWMSNALGIGLNLVACGLIAGFRRPLIELTASSTINDSTYHLASSFLDATMLGLFPDALRVINSGVERGWERVVFPTLVSLLIMTVVGLPAGYGIALLTSPEFLIYVRDMAMMICAGVISYDTYRGYKALNDTGTVAVGNQAAAAVDPEAAALLAAGENHNPQQQYG